MTVEGGLSGIGSIKQGKGHGATKLALQRRDREEGEWATACVYDVDDRVRHTCVHSYPWHGHVEININSVYRGVRVSKSRC